MIGEHTIITETQHDFTHAADTEWQNDAPFHVDRFSIEQAIRDAESTFIVTCPPCPASLNKLDRNTLCAINNRQG